MRTLGILGTPFKASQDSCKDFPQLFSLAGGRQAPRRPVAGRGKWKNNGIAVTVPRKFFKKQIPRKEFSDISRNPVSWKPMEIIEKDYNLKSSHFRRSARRTPRCSVSDPSKITTFWKVIILNWFSIFTTPDLSFSSESDRNPGFSGCPTGAPPPHPCSFPSFQNFPKWEKI